jgi:hypothetical protein
LHGVRPWLQRSRMPTLRFAFSSAQRSSEVVGPEGQCALLNRDRSGRARFYVCFVCLLESENGTRTIKCRDASCPSFLGRCWYRVLARRARVKPRRSNPSRGPLLPPQRARQRCSRGAL